MAVKAVTKEVDGKTCVSTSFLAETFGVSSKTISSWEKKGCPKAAYGYWDLSQVIAWRDDQNKDEYDGKDVTELPLTLQKTYWETRCREEQAENHKFKNAVIRGDYLEKAKVEKELAGFFIILKQSILSIPRKAAIHSAQYIGNERARKLENELTEVMTDVLSQWSHDDFKSGLDTKRPANPASPRTNNRKPVGGRKPDTGRKKQQ